MSPTSVAICTLYNHAGQLVAADDLALPGSEGSILSVTVTGRYMIFTPDDARAPVRLRREGMAVARKRRGFLVMALVEPDGDPSCAEARPGAVLIAGGPALQRLLEEAGFSFSIDASPLRARDQRGGSDEQQGPKRARA